MKKLIAKLLIFLLVFQLTGVTVFASEIHSLLIVDEAVNDKITTTDDKKTVTEDSAVTADKELQDSVDPDMELQDPIDPDMSLQDPVNPDTDLQDPVDPDMSLQDPVDPDMSLQDPADPDMTLPDPVDPDMTLPDLVDPDMTLPDLVDPDMELQDKTEADKELEEKELLEKELQEKLKLEKAQLGPVNAYEGTGIQEIYINDTDGSLKPAYCYNKKLLYPKKEAYGGSSYSEGAIYDKVIASSVVEKIKRAVYGGNAIDGLGYKQKYGLSNTDARIATQSIIWEILGDGAGSLNGVYMLDEPYKNYRNELYDHAINGQLPDIGGVKFTDSTMYELENEKGIYQSEPIKATGYRANYTLSLPEDIQAHLVTDDGFVVTPQENFNTDDTFVLRCDADTAKSLFEGKLQFKGNFAFDIPDEIYFYKPLDKKLQNLLSFSTKNMTIDCTVNIILKEEPPTTPPVKPIDPIDPAPPVDPVDPAPPVDPVDPAPPTPPISPTPPTYNPPVTIPEDDVPLVDVPEDIIIEDDDVPLSDTPDEFIIEDEDVPLSDTPDEFVIEDDDVPLSDTPDEVIEDDDVPLSKTPDEFVIEDDDVPLSDIPVTGDTNSIFIYSIIMGIFMVGFAAFYTAEIKSRKKVK